MVKSKEDKFEWFRRQYGVPARRDAKVKFQGRPAKVVGTRGQYLRLKFDDHDRVNRGHFHPTWEMEWVDAADDADAPSPPTPLPHEACGRGETDLMVGGEL